MWSWHLFSRLVTKGPWNQLSTNWTHFMLACSCEANTKRISTKAIGLHNRMRGSWFTKYLNEVGSSGGGPSSREVRGEEQQPKLTVRCLGVNPNVCAERGSQLPFLLLFIATESGIRFQNITFDLAKEIFNLEHRLFLSVVHRMAKTGYSFGRIYRR